MVADWHGMRYAIATNSGTSALHASVVASCVVLGHPGVRPVLPNLAPALIAFPFLLSDLVDTLRVADVDRSGLINPQSEAFKVAPKPNLVIAVDLHGYPADIFALRAAATAHNSIIIEDRAQALGVTPHTRDARGDLIVLSFEKKKHFTTGSEGGMVLTNDAGLAQCVRRFAGLGYGHLDADGGGTGLSRGCLRPDYLRFTDIGLNYRMNEATAEIGVANWPVVDKLIERRRNCAFYFLAAVVGCNWLTPLPVRDKTNPSYYTVPLRYSGPIPWREFQYRFIQLGGDGFYAAPALVSNEPAIKTLNKGVTNYGTPLAHKLQQSLMLFKTHYPDPATAKQQAAILRQLIESLS